MKPWAYEIIFDAYKAWPQHRKTGIQPSSNSEGHYSRWGKHIATGDNPPRDRAIHGPTR